MHELAGWRDDAPKRVRRVSREAQDGGQQAGPVRGPVLGPAHHPTHSWHGTPSLFSFMHLFKSSSPPAPSIWFSKVYSCFGYSGYRGTFSIVSAFYMKRHASLQSSQRIALLPCSSISSHRCTTYITLGANSSVFPLRSCNYVFILLIVVQPSQQPR
jgi:hypothetical protein